MITYYTQIQRTLKSLIFSLFIIFGIFTVPAMGQSLTVLTPNGGEIWTFGDSETVSWTGQGLGNFVILEFSPDGGDSWWYMGEYPSDPNGGSTLVSPYKYSTTNALLKITDYFNPLASDISDAPFTNYVKVINIIQPLSESVIFANELANVIWITNDPDISLVNIDVSIDNGQTYELLVENLNAQAYATYLDLPDTPSDSCFLKFYNAEDPSEYVLSEVLKIRIKPVYYLTSPAGGEFFNTYSPLTISWNIENSYSDYCELEYSTDNGITWMFINSASSTGNFGNYEWTTPNVNSEECMIRIRDSYAQSAMDTSAAFTIMSFPETSPCMVTVDSLTNYNVIVWEKPDTDLITNFLVYKESDQANVYTVIDTVDYNELSVVTDEGSNPTIRPYRYKIGFLDNQNRVFPAGDYHQTIHLTINQGVGNNWNLIWTPYIGFDFSSYTILRKSGSGVYEEIATVSASFNSFTDLNAPVGYASYIIKIVRSSGCNTDLRHTNYTDVYSNKASLAAVWAADKTKVNFSIYPNPANDKINITFGERNIGLTILKISDLTGRIVYSDKFRDVQAGQMKSINSSAFKNGLYLIQIASGDKVSTNKILIRQ